MGRPKLNQSRDKKYYGVPTRIKPQIVAKITKLYPGPGALNHKLLKLCQEIDTMRRAVPIKNPTHRAYVGDGLENIINDDKKKVEQLVKDAKKGNRNKDNKVGSTTTR